jgi:hypothetical protein
LIKYRHNGLGCKAFSSESVSDVNRILLNWLAAKEL